MDRDFPIGPISSVDKPILDELAKRGGYFHVKSVKSQGMTDDFEAHVYEVIVYYCLNRNSNELMACLGVLTRNFYVGWLPFFEALHSAFLNNVLPEDLLPEGKSCWDYYINIRN